MDIILALKMTFMWVGFILIDFVPTFQTFVSQEIHNSIWTWFNFWPFKPHFKQLKLLANCNSQSGNAIWDFSSFFLCFHTLSTLILLGLHHVLDSCLGDSLLHLIIWISFLYHAPTLKNKSMATLTLYGTCWKLHFLSIVLFRLNF